VKYKIEVDSWPDLTFPPVNLHSAPNVQNLIGDQILEHKLTQDEQIEHYGEILDQLNDKILAMRRGDVAVEDVQSVLEDIVKYAVKVALVEYDKSLGIV
jgi:hypothetical protein